MKVVLVLFIIIIIAFYFFCKNNNIFLKCKTITKISILYSWKHASYSIDSTFVIKPLMLHPERFKMF